MAGLSIPLFAICTSVVQGSWRTAILNNLPSIVPRHLRQVLTAVLFWEIKSGELPE